MGRAEAKGGVKRDQMVESDEQSQGPFFPPPGYDNILSRVLRALCVDAETAPVEEANCMKTRPQPRHRAATIPELDSEK